MFTLLMAPPTSRVRTGAVSAAFIATVALGATFGVSTSANGASTFKPTRFDDPAPGSCLPRDCSLREAVIAANAAGGSTIVLKAGIYSLARKGVDANAPNPKIGDLDIRAGMTIN